MKYSFQIINRTFLTRKFFVLFFCLLTIVNDRQMCYSSLPSLSDFSLTRRLAHTLVDRLRLIVGEYTHPVAEQIYVYTFQYWCNQISAWPYSTSASLDQNRREFFSFSSSLSPVRRRIFSFFLEDILSFLVGRHSTQHNTSEQTSQPTDRFRFFFLCFFIVIITPFSSTHD